MMRAWTTCGGLSAGSRALPPGWQVTGLTWDQARAALLAELREFADEEDCPHCLGQARAAIAALTALPPGAALRENIDGSDYVLEKAAEGKPPEGKS